MNGDKRNDSWIIASLIGIMFCIWLLSRCIDQDRARIATLELEVKALTALAK